MVYITVNKIEYPIHFGYGANKILARKWKLKTMGEIGAAVSKRFSFKKNQEPTFTQWDYIGDLVHSGILHKTPTAKVTPNELVDYLMLKPDKLLEIFNLYSDSLPKPGGAEPKKK